MPNYLFKTVVFAISYIIAGNLFPPPPLHPPTPTAKLPEWVLQEVFGYPDPPQPSPLGLPTPCLGANNELFLDILTIISSFLPWLLLLLSTAGLIGCLFLAKALSDRLRHCTSVHSNEPKAEQDDTEDKTATVESAVMFANLVLTLLPALGSEIAEILEIPIEHSKVLKSVPDLSSCSASSLLSRAARALPGALQTDLPILFFPPEPVSSGNEMVCEVPTGEDSGAPAMDAPLVARTPSPPPSPSDSGAVSLLVGESQTDVVLDRPESAISTDGNQRKKPTRRAGKKITALRHLRSAEAGAIEEAPVKAEAVASATASAETAVECAQQPTSSAHEAETSSSAFTTGTVPTVDQTTASSNVVEAAHDAVPSSGGLWSSRWAPVASEATAVPASSGGQATTVQTRGLEASRWAGGSLPESSNRNRGGRGGSKRRGPSG